MVPAPAGGASGYSCNVTAGAVSTLRGYNVSVPIGSIDNQPVPGQALNYCYTNGTSLFYVAFAGDVSTLLAGMHVWLDGVDYGIGDSTYRFNYSSGTTKWRITSGYTPMVDGNTYFLEIK